MDTEDGLIYEEKPFHGIKVKAATIDKLVTYCLDQFGKQYSYILIHYMSLVSFCLSSKGTMQRKGLPKNYFLNKFKVSRFTEALV